jgi:hypothetical protein
MALDEVNDYDDSWVYEPMDIEVFSFISKLT